MPRPVPVYIVPRPRLRDQLLVGLLLIGAAAYLLKAVIVMALWAAGLLVVGAIACAWPRTFFFALLVGGGIYLLRDSPGLTIGWAVVSTLAVLWMASRRAAG